MANLFIPTTIKVGFQERPGTFTGKLAYVIYYDEKGKLRKETSWKSWCTDKLGSVEFENTPMNGFMFNKGIQRSSEWFGSGRSVFRVYAPHDFEFEINSDNLINLLMHTDVSKREILEQCVFAWHGTELILLPVNSVEYQESVAYTAKQAQKVSAKDLVKGRQYYKRKTNEIITYMGRFDWWDFGYASGRRYGQGYEDPLLHRNAGKKHICWTGSSFEPFSPATLSCAASDDVVEDYAELVDKFFATKHSQTVKGMKMEFGTILVPEVDPNHDRYPRYPEMWKLDSDDIHNVYTSNWYDRSFSEATVRQQGKQLIIDQDGNVSVKTITWAVQRSTPYYYYGSTNYYTSYERDIAISLHAILQPLALKKEYDYDNLTPTQYVELMTELGYGRVKLILQNDQEIDFTDYY